MICTWCPLVVHVLIDFSVQWGNWGTWGAWSKCSSGLQTRTRQCDPAPGSNYPDCSGLATETQQCSLPINGNWGQWSAWGTCVSGRRTRTRRCNNPEPFNGGQDCVSLQLGARDIQQCTTGLFYHFLLMVS